MSDLISRQAAIELVDWYQHEFCECDYAFGELANELSKLPSAQSSEDTKAAFEQGRTQGHVEMRTELLMQLKEIVGDEVWKNI